MKNRVKEPSADLFERVQESLNVIRPLAKDVPEILIILGTGLGDLSKKIKAQVKIPYEKIPNFPLTTAESHAGNLVFGTLAGKKVVAMEGRFHAYEGYTPEEITFPIRVLKMFGAKILVVSNAAGGLNLAYRKGEIILIEDHINFMGINPLIGPN
ncbi:MAG TPA: purine-nucleoside phosphorylase, partial [bacterium]|nr:purine-nucleoside phosphorylase [bacterium]